ncbi:extracellular solute-binding protein, partial [Ruminococcaceae bacterium OttesenSCG-928-L11]|nr:extracellular solute-binding protein [Ruminococcaceae bacterium OttesenSCG-928-L11]
MRRNNVMKIRNLACLLLVMCLLLAAAGCGGGTTASSTATASSQPAGSSAAPAESKAESKAEPAAIAPIKWLTTGDTGAKPMASGDRVVAQINEQLGIELTVQIVPEGNVEKVNVAMASGDFPDVVTGQYGNSATQQWIDNEMVIDLSPYFAENPSLRDRVEGTYSWTAIDGKYYGVPFITQYTTANALIAMRQDWLDNLNLTYPETLEDMKTVLTAFTFDDPDGNGKQDTYGYTSQKPAGNTQFEWVFGALGRKYSDYGLADDGTIIPWFEGDYFIPGMEYIKDLWDSGVVDSELFLNDNPKKEEKFYQGKAGAMSAALFRHVSRHERNLQQITPEASLAYGLPPKGPDGSFGMNPQGKSGMYTCITAVCKAPEKAAAFLNLMVSDEGNDLLRLGIEGTHYTVENGNVVFNEEERAKDAFSDNGWAHPLAWGSFFWPLESGYLPDTEPSADRALESTKLATEAMLPNLIKE